MFQNYTKKYPQISIREGFQDQIISLHNNLSESNLVREPQSWELCKKNRVKVYSLFLDGKIQAYALVNKGRDLQSVCHEIIATNNDFLLDLASQLDPSTIFLLSDSQLKKFPQHHFASRGIQALVRGQSPTPWIYGLDSC